MTSATTSLHGLWVPIVTPFTSDGQIDEPSLRRLAGDLLASGVDGLVALGTTGEPATLSLEERRAVVAICGEACASAARPLMVGAGTNCTAGTVAEIRQLCEMASVHATLIVTPYYTRPSEEAVVEHLGIVADQSPVPVVAYNIPYRTGRGLDASSLMAAGAHGNIAGLKQSVGSLDGDTLELLGSSGPCFQVLAGDDAFIVPTILMGGVGAIAAAAHVCTARFVDMVAAARSNDVETARALAHAVLSVVQAGFREPSPAVWKQALAQRGVIETGFVRRPLTVASAVAADGLVAACERVEG